MAHVILGLLLLRSMSLYDLIRAFEAGVSLFYSASSGSIKRALDGLLVSGRVEVESVDAGARGRKVYRVTAEGRAAFGAWMHSELTEASVETAALSRLYFLGLIDAAERPQVLDLIEARIAGDLARLEALADLVNGTDVPPELGHVARYQKATLAYGLESHRFALDWFRTAASQ
ncbi:MAG: helix-turn-helix transcriptional regulator [Propionibacteriaceae bacterium]|nr:helix-turn-helix transcriptional regulator [Propionibacteriaceae bacterium]